MPVALKTSNVKNVSKSMRYITTGKTENQGHAKFNQPHTNRGDKAVKERNYLLEGINTRNDFTNPKHGYKEALSDFHYWLSQKKELGKNQHNAIAGTNYVLAFGSDFDWRKHGDLYLGRDYVHEFIHRIAPHSPAYTGYQMDTRGSIPSAHVHICVANVDTRNLHSVRGNSQHYQYINRVQSYLTHEFNLAHPSHKIHDPLQMKATTPTRAQRSVIARILPVATNRSIASPTEFQSLALSHGVIAHFKHKGDRILRKKKKHYQHDGLVFKVAGSNGSNGYIKSSSLREFVPSLDVQKLEHQFHLNQAHAMNIMSATSNLTSASNSRRASLGAIQSRASSAISSESRSSNDSNIRLNVIANSEKSFMSDVNHDINIHTRINSASAYNRNLHNLHQFSASFNRQSQRSSALSELSSRSVARDASDILNHTVIAKRGMEYSFEYNQARAVSLKQSLRSSYANSVISSIDTSASSALNPLLKYEKSISNLSHSYNSISSALHRSKFSNILGQIAELNKHNATSTGNGSNSDIRINRSTSPITGKSSIDVGNNTATNRSQSLEQNAQVARASGSNISNISSSSNRGSSNGNSSSNSMVVPSYVLDELSYDEAKSSNAYSTDSIGSIESKKIYSSVSSNNIRAINSANDRDIFATIDTSEVSNPAIVKSSKASEISKESYINSVNDKDIFNTIDTNTTSSSVSSSASSSTNNILYSSKNSSVSNQTSYTASQLSMAHEYDVKTNIASTMYKNSPIHLKLYKVELAHIIDNKIHHKKTGSFISELDTMASNVDTVYSYSHSSANNSASSADSSSNSSSSISSLSHLNFGFGNNSSNNGIQFGRGIQR